MFIRRVLRLPFARTRDLYVMRIESIRRRFPLREQRNAMRFRIGVSFFSPPLPTILSAALMIPVARISLAPQIFLDRGLVQRFWQILGVESGHTLECDRV